MARPIHTLVLKSSKTIAPHVLHLTFECEGVDQFNFLPGQFITIHIPLNDKVLNRSYSIANIEQNNHIEFAASYVEKGTASNLLFNLKPGDKLNATGPFGRLILRDEKPSRYLLIATGTGITPYRAMLKELERRLHEQENLRVILLFGVRKPEDLFYREEFVSFAEKNPRFEFRVHYSRIMPSPPLPYEFQGYVHTALTDIKPDPLNDLVYLCGNPNMIDETYSILCQYGFAVQNVRREKYISGS
jgi:ferredoxin-NADP reductase